MQRLFDFTDAKGKNHGRFFMQTYCQVVLEPEVFRVLHHQVNGDLLTRGVIFLLEVRLGTEHGYLFGGVGGTCSMAGTRIMLRLLVARLVQVDGELVVALPHEQVRMVEHSVLPSQGVGFALAQ